MKKAVTYISLISIAAAYCAYNVIIKPQHETHYKKDSNTVIKTKYEPTTSTWSDTLNIFSSNNLKPSQTEKNTVGKIFKPNAVILEQPIPYKYIGKMIYENTQYIFLEYNNQTIVVKEGNILPGNYRYDYLEKNKLIFTDMRDFSKREITIGAET
ncbi:hypothetical protein [Candidatus Ichthyocystis sparus]|uniref:hypothetical protein n=1 Tax=Candidatus Ichthyocystis sparus TaxID=1561004 RepID=UPI000B818D54|nr:hypothetical protein [Candidatus Ichthyocystis sparus]